MREPGKTEAERRSQDGFSNRALFGALLLLAAAILGASIARLWIPDREEAGPRLAAVRYEPVSLGLGNIAPLRLAGAWKVAVYDPRFGGVSALAVDGGELVALTDSGVVARLPRPGSGKAAARLGELPDGPGDPRFKRRRDSEGLARDPAGRGWWVAFEQRHELWLYDRGFERALEWVRFAPDRWSFNSGIEALASRGGDLLILPEPGRTVLRLRHRPSRLEEARLEGRAGRISDAAVLPGGPVLLIERRMTLRGFANALVVLEEGPEGYRKGARVPLGLGPLDNAEALAAEPRSGGGVRLWLMTDDNHQRPLRTLLVALDLPGRGNGGGPQGIGPRD